MRGTVLRSDAYVAVFGGLVLLTLLTVSASFLRLGPWHVVVGLCFAAAKAALVALFFMHLWGGLRRASSGWASC